MQTHFITFGQITPVEPDLDSIINELKRKNQGTKEKQETKYQISENVMLKMQPKKTQKEKKKQKRKHCHQQRQEGNACSQYLNGLKHSTCSSLQ